MSHGPMAEAPAFHWSREQTSREERGRSFHRLGKAKPPGFAFEARASVRHRFSRGSRRALSQVSLFPWFRPGSHGVAAPTAGGAL